MLCLGSKQKILFLISIFYLDLSHITKSKTVESSLLLARALGKCTCARRVHTESPWQSHCTRGGGCTFWLINSIESF